MNPGTEDSLWLVIKPIIINIIIMSGHAKKLLQEVLRHELGVTVTPWTAVSKGQSKAVFSVKDSLCWPQDDSTHKDNGCGAADRIKSSHSLFHGNWLEHPPL